MLHFTRHSRPLDKVGLAPRQYTEWNEVGHTHSAGDHSQQGLLPEVHCTACTKCMFTKTTKNQRPRALSPGGLYSWWHFASPANRSRSRDCALVMWAYGARCPAMVSPNAGLCVACGFSVPENPLNLCFYFYILAGTRGPDPAFHNGRGYCGWSAERPLTLGSTGERCWI